MTRPHPLARSPLAILGAALAFLAAVSPIPSWALPNDTPAQTKDGAPAPVGRFFSVEQPITSEIVERFKVAAKALVQQAAKDGKRPVLFLEFQPGAPSEQGPAADLARFLSRGLTGERTVAYVPAPLSGYATMAALACDEIVMGTDGSLGPITPENEPVDTTLGAFLRRLASDTGRDPGLLLGMLDREADLRAVRTADRQLHFVLKDDLPEFRKDRAVLDDEPAWEAGRRGLLTSARAREIGVSSRTAEDRSAVSEPFGLSAADDPTLGQVPVPVWIQIKGPVDVLAQQYLKRRVAQARQEKANLIFFEIDSPGGLDTAADGVADLIVNLKEIKTVAYVRNATGVSVLIALACKEIVFHKDGRMGDVRENLLGREGPSEVLSPAQFQAIQDKAATLAKANGHPPAVARAMADPQSVVVSAKDNQTGAVSLILREQVQAEPGRFEEQGVFKVAGDPLSLTADRALESRMARDVVADEKGLKAIYGLANKDIRVEGPNWVDNLVSTLNTRWMSGLLLFIGFFMLVLELKMPGIGLPAITSALAFLLFFWSRYLSGTADSLEIMLFLVGMVCLALELFVFPGFGVFGMSGILLILVSVVMASHTFVWPSRGYEYRQMGQTLMQLCLAIVAVTACAVIVGRYLPSLPLFNRMVLKPEPLDGPYDPTAKPTADPDAPLFYLIGETGRTTSVLRPTGKARFGELLVDVTADGFFIEPGCLVEVVEVQGARVIVRKV